MVENLKFFIQKSKGIGLLSQKRTIETKEHNRIHLEFRHLLFSFVSIVLKKYR